jgi:hypothetical protein
MSAKRKGVPWVSVYDSELKRWLTWEDMGTKWYRERQAQRHHAHANHPLIWALQSNSLHLAARSLWQSDNAERGSLGEREKIALMLGGMSIECAVKSRLMTFYKYPLSPDDQKKIFSGTHDLVKLTATARIRTNKSDRKVLSSLSMYVRWLGRYPTPRSLEEMVQYWFNTERPDHAFWSQYCSVREKIGFSVSRALRDWRGN